MSSFFESDDLFDESAREQIRADFAFKCALCRHQPKAGEECFVPILNSRFMFYACFEGLYTLRYQPHDASNALYACEMCASNWLMGSDEVLPLAVLMLCEPLVAYALHVFSLADDEESELQTLDSMFEDLARDPDSTSERRAAAPFLDCYQLCPVLLAPETRSGDSACLVIGPSPTTYLDHDGHRYCVLEPESSVSPDGVHPRLAPLHDQSIDGATTLWRIKNRSPGLLSGRADVTSARRSPKHPLHEELYERLKGERYPVECLLDFDVDYADIFEAEWPGVVDITPLREIRRKMLASRDSHDHTNHRVSLLKQ